MMKSIIKISLITVFFCFISYSGLAQDFPKLNESIIEKSKDVNASEFKNSSENKVRFLCKNCKSCEPIYVLDGEMITKDRFRKLDVKSIARLNVLKNKNAINKYGEKAKNGVIEILSKSIVKP